MDEAIRFLLDPASWAGPDGLGAQLTQQLLLTVTAMGIACAAGLPLALWLGHVGGGILVAGVALLLEGALALVERWTDPVRRGRSRTGVKGVSTVARPVT